MNSSQHFFSSSYPQSSRPLAVVGILCVALLVLFYLSDVSLRKYPEGIMTLIFLGCLVTQRWILLKDIGVRLIAIGLLLPFIFLGMNTLDNPATAIAYFGHEKLVKLTGFAAVGFWLGGRLRNIQLFLALTFMGLVIALFNVDAFTEFKRILSGERVDFELRNAQHASMYFGIAIIGLLACYRCIILGRLSVLSKIVFSILWAIALGITLIAFIGTQTRATLLAFIFLYGLSMLWMGVTFYKKEISIRHKLFIVLTLVIPITFLLPVTHQVLSHRSSEITVVDMLAKGDLNHIPMTSLGIRVNSWLLASDSISQKPLQGWGSKAAGPIIQKSDFPDDIKSKFGHFHNSYLEFTVAYGVTGLGYILFIFIWLNRRIYRISRYKPEFKPVWHFTIFGSLFMMIINVSESLLFFGTGAYTMAILLAPAYSVHLADLYEQHTQHASLK